MKRLSRFIVVAAFAGCASPQPPTRAPDFAGRVIAAGVGNDGGAHLLVELAPRMPNAFPTLMPGPGTSAVRADVALMSAALILARQPDGTYRHVMPASTWEGRTVHVWVAHAMSAPENTSFEAEASAVVIEMPTVSRSP